MLTHDANFPYTCNHCPKTFRRSDHLALHLQKHQENSTVNACGTRRIELTGDALTGFSIDYSKAPCLKEENL